ncbi:MAG: cofactor-independent phosphoglycerate mutase [Thermoguttaceae bacterium]
MKYIIIIPDGCADVPLESLGGKTPMQAAHLPNLDSLAARGVVGRASFCPETLAPGSDACNLSILGYDPQQVYSGRAPLEAAALGVELGDGDWALRCNAVCVEDDVMQSFSAGNISTDESTAILESVGTSLAASVGKSLTFMPSVGYRNLVVWRGDGVPVPLSPATKTFPPHDLTGQRVESFLPRGDGSEVLRTLFEESGRLLASHPVNVARRAAGKLPCTHLWFWAQGKRPALPLFAERFGIARGAMISAVDLLRGIATLIGWSNIRVAGATGDVHTDYAAKGRAAALAIEDYDIVCVHIEAPDEASHDGDAVAKVTALEQIDALTLPPILDALANQRDWRILVTPDHLTPITTKTHAHGLVPWLVAGSDVAPLSPQVVSYDEVAATTSPHIIADGHRLMQIWTSPKFF